MSRGCCIVRHPNRKDLITHFDSTFDSTFDLGLLPSLTIIAFLPETNNEDGTPDFCSRLCGVPAASRERRVNAYFRRELADYIEYHRNWWNGVMHVFGIICLFLAAVLPLSLWPVTVFGMPTTAATIAALPVLIYWFLLDAALGAGIFVAAVLELSASAMIVSHVTVIGVWLITAVLIPAGVAFQVVGHRVFERRQPSLVHNPTHLLLGPMFVVAKLYIALGFRHDLAVIIDGPSKQTPRSSTLFSGKP